MKAKELISILQACNPDDDVRLTFGSSYSYRMNTVHYISKTKADSILTDLKINHVVIAEDENGLGCHLYIDQEHIDYNTMCNDLSKIVYEEKENAKTKA